MSSSLIPSAGWTVSHWFYRIDRARWRGLSADARADAVAEAGRGLGGGLAQAGAKARRDGDNWFTLPFEARKKLMQGHGEAGRRYATRVTQLITSATGIDDWEWGVTLFSNDLKAIRDVVYEMRFDPGSARYGLFG